MMLKIDIAGRPKQGGQLFDGYASVDRLSLVP